MKVDERRRRRRGAAVLVVAGLAMATLLTRAAAAEAPPPPAVAAQAAPWCQRDQDLACTLVRETAAGVWIWTERFRPAEPGNSGWTLAVGAGPVSPAVTHLIAAIPALARPTPNGAPILE